MCTVPCNSVVNEALKIDEQKFNALERKRTWQGTVPETSAKVYGACCTPTLHRNVLAQCMVATLCQ